MFVLRCPAMEKCAREIHSKAYIDDRLRRCYGKSRDMRRENASQSV